MDRRFPSLGRVGSALLPEQWHPEQWRRLRPLVLLALMLVVLCNCQTADQDKEKKTARISGLERLLSGEAQVSVNGGQPASLAVDTVIEHEDGTVTLLTPTPAHVIAHTRKCLYDLNYDLLLEQIIAGETKDTYEARGKDPGECADWFSENLRDVMMLLARMSGGMSSPNVASTYSGKYLQMKLYGRAAEGMRFTTVEMTQEMGQFKLLMIY